jgi:hypothetical protein
VTGVDDADEGNDGEDEEEVDNEVAEFVELRVERMVLGVC